MDNLCSNSSNAKRRTRVFTLTDLLPASSVTAVGSSPTANIGLGTAICAHITHMRNILEIRGGQILSSKVNKNVLDSVKTPVSEIHPYRTEFTYNSNMIIGNMFQDHIAWRYFQGSAQKIKTVTPTYLAPIASVSTDISNSILSFLVR